MASALEPGTIGSLRLRNRIVMGSMHLGFEDDAARLRAFYEERARGQAGLIVTGGSAVSRTGSGGRNYSFINDQRAWPALREAARGVHDAGGRIALQLFHAGRYAYRASFGLDPVAPSAIASRFSPDPPRALDEAGIFETIEDFARGAARAAELGFDAVEIMGSEGYLLNQFLSPLTNRREDAWGGNVERRMRFPLEVVHAVRARTGNAFPIVFRISGADLMAGSSTQEETLAFAVALSRAGVDALNVGIGWHESPVPTIQQMVPSGVWLPFATAIKSAVGALPVIASNRIASLTAANDVMARANVDFVSMARPFLADAEIVAKSARGEAVLVNTCIACNQACLDRSLVDAPVSCMVNPRAGRELRYAASGSPRMRRRFAVVGGGPAGMESARTFAAFGHDVVLFESDSELGGQFRMARRIPGKREFGETIRYFSNELQRLGARVALDTRVEAARELEGFDAVVVATGVRPRAVRIPGSELSHVVTYVDVLARSCPVGERVAIVGAGGIGVDLAHFFGFGRSNGDDVARFLYEHGLATDPSGAIVVTGRRAVALLRRGAVIGEGIGRTTRWAVMRALREAGIVTYPNVAYDAIVPEGIRVRDADGTLRTLEADTVVIAAGQERNDALVPLVTSLGIPYRVAGGAKEAGELDAVRAFDEGLRAAHELMQSLEV